MKTSLRNILTLAFLSFILVGCNTMQGLGEDIQRAGGAIRDAADRNPDQSEAE